MAKKPEDFVTRYRHTKKSAIMITAKLIRSICDEAEKVGKIPLLKFCIENGKIRWNLKVSITKEKVA